MHTFILVTQAFGVPKRNNCHFLIKLYLCDVVQLFSILHDMTGDGTIPRLAVRTTWFVECLGFRGRTLTLFGDMHEFESLVVGQRL